jgi:hypothetical protein
VNDGPDVTHFKITNITNGTLFKNNGSTQINNGDFITVAEGSNVGGAGLKFTPATNLYIPGTTFTFNAAGATSAGGAGLGNTTAASITVNAVNDIPSFTKGRIRLCWPTLAPRRSMDGPRLVGGTR